MIVAALVLAAALVWAQQSIDWLDRTHPMLRALKMAGVLGGVGVLYVAVLAALGLKPRQFMRKA